jgi:DNA-directed RNA polymerase subunit omega
MARVTIEDCTLKIPSRFELVVLAALRAKEIGAGAKPLVSRDKDKNPVIALREIAEGLVTQESLKEALVKKNQRRQAVAEQDLPDEDVMQISEAAAEVQSYKAEVATDDEMDSMYEDMEESEDLD